MNRLVITCLMIELALLAFSACARTRPVFDPGPARPPRKPSKEVAAEAFAPPVPPADANVAESAADLPAAETLLALVGVANVLTLEDIEKLALANNPTLLQAQARIDVHKGTRIQAGLRPNPRLGYQHNEAGNNGRGGQQGVYVAQEFIRGGKRELEQRAAAHAVQAAGYRKSAQRYRVKTAVRTAFYDVLIAQQTIALAEELLRMSQQGIETTGALLSGGQATRVDLLQARVEKYHAEIVVEQARNRYQADWERMVSVIGMPDLMPTKLVGSLVIQDKQLDRERVLQDILMTSPELTAAHYQVDRARIAVERMRVEPIPDVDVQTGVQYDYSTSNTIANVQIEMPWAVRNFNQGNVMKAQAAFISAQREVERVELDLRRRFALTFERYANATIQVDRYQGSILPAAKESLELLSKIYRTEGRIDFVRLLIAQKTNFQAQMDYLGALRDWWSARLEIDGLLLTDGLAIPVDGVTEQSR